MYVVTLNKPVASVYDKSPPALKLPLMSAALGPVYVSTPVELSYANEPKPPASVALILVLDLACVKY